MGFLHRLRNLFLLNSGYCYSWWDRDKLMTRLSLL